MCRYDPSLWMYRIAVEQSVYLEREWTPTCNQTCKPGVVSIKTSKKAELWAELAKKTTVNCELPRYLCLEKRHLTYLNLIRSSPTPLELLSGALQAGEVAPKVVELARARKV